MIIMDMHGKYIFYKYNNLPLINRNPSVPCNSLPDTDLRAWKEEPGMISPNSIGINKKK
jgi:hypothetical protein